MLKQIRALSHIIYTLIDCCRHTAMENAAKNQTKHKQKKINNRQNGSIRKIIEKCKKKYGKKISVFDLIN